MLSDLDYLNDTLVPRTSAQTQPARETRGSGPVSAQDAVQSVNGDAMAATDNLSSMLDQSNLSSSDRALLAPLLADLQSSNAEIETLNEGDLDLTAAELNARLDKLNDVVDQLDGKLDSLLASLDGMGDELAQSLQRNQENA
ncbi:uncharacterized protein L969DRAFT_49805 [Mixia osmundae IAM 14324]|uniref:Uncharacterized protein n=1 Tax=Mixia osmundae (strain CBS 9802 / IAM 14324 / JCM 22182 / KY 12970) TaxID=764103 RepID=G7E0Y1_MIXOS|nr:uncharacterized protein L969DRAFT_49805 [Mixia osmundae IAM 14324]KEI38875.1 hypothetical protein L969DRAFT_49805 [Mixia osmundae IAM 14324]GAA96491.1 hypothetical protein E5Q_03159 [Mixia osmundae IAM 14324]